MSPLPLATKYAVPGAHRVLPRRTQLGYGSDSAIVAIRWQRSQEESEAGKGMGPPLSAGRGIPGSSGAARNDSWTTSSVRASGDRSTRAGARPAVPFQADVARASWHPLSAKQEVTGYRRNRVKSSTTDSGGAQYVWYPNVAQKAVGSKFLSSITLQRSTRGQLLYYKSPILGKEVAYETTRKPTRTGAATVACD